MKHASDSKIYDCIVVGAGASGLFYAAAASAPGAALVIEKTSHPGQKLLLSGNGMCNITHGGSIKEFITHYGEHGSRIRSCLYKHSNLELMRFIEDGGVRLVTRSDGKVFPASMKARDVLDMLLAKASASGFSFLYNSEAAAINDTGNDLVELTVCKGPGGIRHKLVTRKLVIAAGGASYPATGSDGTFADIMQRDLNVKINPLKPALAPVYVENYPYSGLSGISFDNVHASIGQHSLHGPLLFTHRGFSGPVILHLSQYAAAGMPLVLNFLPGENTDSVLARLKQDQPGNRKSAANHIASAFDLPRAFAEIICGTDSRNFASLNGAALKKTAQNLTCSTYTVSGTGGFREAMVTAGGVSLDELDLRNMSLTAHPSIRVIGEAVDINGDTGGYNLQFAYSSALAAL